MDYLKELDAAVTICDKEGIVVYMNDKSIKTFQKDGGADLIGRNLYDCHPQPAIEKMKHILQTGESNTYSIEKNGIKKIIFQYPWIQNGAIEGLVEICFAVPFDMPHFVRPNTI